MKNRKNISGFAVPENYFDNFQERLFNRIEEEKLPKSAGFSVPEGYFNTLEDRILSSSPLSGSRAKVMPLFRRRNYGYAAAVAACLLLGYFIFNMGQVQLTTDTISLSALDRYIDEGNLNLDLYDIANYLDEGDITALNSETHQLSQTALESYLWENTDEEILADNEK